MITKISNFFTWWDGQTIGTVIYTKFFGKFVGKDEFGNSYFTTSDGKKRWVNYRGLCDASRISPSWHSWLHKTTDNVPFLEIEKKLKNKSDINFTLSETLDKYHPNDTKNHLILTEYETWKPKV